MWPFLCENRSEMKELLNKKDWGIKFFIESKLLIKRIYFTFANINHKLFY